MGGKAFTEFQKETAFDVYYAMGAARDLKGLARALVGAENFEDGSPAWKTLKSWSADNNWQERAKLRDIANSKIEQDKTDKEVVNTKADYRKWIKERIEEDKKLDGYVTALIGKTKKKIEKGELEVVTIKELTELTRAHQGSTAKKIELMKLDLLMMGEADSHQEHSFLDALRERRRQRDDGDA